MTEEVKKQQILLPCDFSVAFENAVACATELATMFACEITLFYTRTKKISALERKEFVEEETIKKKLFFVAEKIKNNYGITTNIFVFKDEVHKVINDIYASINAIAVIAYLNDKKMYYHYFTAGDIATDYRNLRIPIIVVHEDKTRKTYFRNILLPLDFNRESKEKSAWAGHISTLNQTVVTILVRNYKDSYFAASLRSNIALVTRLFDNLGVTYKLVREPDLKCDIDKYALDYAFYNKNDMVVLMATKEIAIDDLLFGLKEKKLIKNKYKLPIMLINPRDDLYLPCGC